MEFITEAQEITYMKVNKFLNQIFGEMIKKSTEKTVFLYQKGSTVTHIAIWPWRDNDAIVCVRSYVNFGAELVPELLHHLLTVNNDMRFGAFGIDEDGDIYFERTIVGSTCNKKEIKTSVLAVSHTADKYDEPIMKKWGGVRQIDRIKEIL